jgi:hypothetical protein
MEATHQRGLLGPHKIIGPVDDPYMLRWFIFRFSKLPRIYIHKFMRSDDDRGLHDHPWWFISIILRGSYFEIRPDNGLNYRKAGSVAFRRATDRHRVVLEADFDSDGKLTRPKPVWTLFITRPVVRIWGFWCEKQDEYKYPFGMETTVPERFIPAHGFDGCD